MLKAAKPTPKSKGKTSTPRKASLTAIAHKCAKLESQWSEPTQAQEDAAFDLDLALIVQELQHNLEKIKGCKVAVMGSAFLPKSAKDARFHTSYVYLSKVPKSFLETWFFELDARFNADGRKALYGADRSIFPNIMYRTTLTDKGSRIPDHNHEAFKQFMADRMKGDGCALKDIVWANNGKVDWDKCGCFVLAPPRSRRPIPAPLGALRKSRLWAPRSSM